MKESVILLLIPLKVQFVAFVVSEQASAPYITLKTNRGQHITHYES